MRHIVPLIMAEYATVCAKDYDIILPFSTINNQKPENQSVQYLGTELAELELAICISLMKLYANYRSIPGVDCAIIRSWKGVS
jgi:branched-subunit amino acid transport protein AzlD